VNKAIVTTTYPIPRIDDLIVKMKNARYFTSLDLKCAYLQLTLHQDSRDLTSFITHKGLYRFLRVPYGLCSAPGAFQRLMEEVLEGIKNVVVYLDDVIVFGKTETEHDNTLIEVKKKLTDSGIQLNIEKCVMKSRKIKVLGHEISDHGILPDETHLNALKHIQRPINRKELKSFLGLTSWFGKFIHNYSTIVQPLREIARLDKYQWNSDAEKSFNDTKNVIIKSEALEIFDTDRQTIITTDANY